MQYLEKTLQVRTALLEQPHFLDEMRAIFASHLAEDDVYEPMVKGNDRWVYQVGECEIASGIAIHLLLKLEADLSFMKYSYAAERSQFSYWSEFGVFEMYYDFVAGHISTISFRSKAGYERYREASVPSMVVSQTFTLSESWGGTRVDQGDMGAIPYFQMAVRYGEWFGYLTEGNPPFIEPKNTASDFMTEDDYTVERGRIIDFDRSQSLLVHIDRGGYLGPRERYPNNLGVRLRGEKYFRPKHRLNL